MKNTPNPMNNPLKPPKVSVIVPNYNHARYLEKRIQTVLDQTFQDFELIYLDDASTDGSDQVFARFAFHPRIRAVLNSQNSGTPFKQWNKGVGEARGEYIWLAEADDFADPRLLETLIGLLDAHPNVGIAYCSSWTVDKNDRVMGQLPAPLYPELHPGGAAPAPSVAPAAPASNAPASIPTLTTLSDWNGEPWQQSFVADGEKFYRHFMIYENRVPNASGVVFRKSVYLEAGGAVESMRVCGDYIAWIEMLKRADVAYCAQPLNYFRMHLGSARSTSNKSGLWALERYQVASTILRDVGGQLETREIDHLCHIRMGHWLEDLFHPTRRVPWQRTQAMFALARRTDPQFGRRLAWQTTFFLMQRAPFFGVVRDIARRFVWRSRAKVETP